MKQYLDLAQDILDNGVVSEDRTGTGTISVFGRQMSFDLSKGFPLLTTKKLHFKSIAIELLWFLSGNTNTKFLTDNGVTIWDNWLKPFEPYTNKLIKMKVKTNEYEPLHQELINIPLGRTLKPLEVKLRSSWKKMIDRCYNKDAHNYGMYGAKGISVCKRWQNFHNYLDDVTKLHNWNYKRLHWNDFELDKDYYNLKQYCPEGCIWLSKEHNVPSNFIKITNKANGKSFVFSSIAKASAFTNISKTTIHRFLREGLPLNGLKGRNRRMRLNEWEFKPVYEKDHFFRFELSPDNDLGPVYGKQWTNWTVKEYLNVNDSDGARKLTNKGFKLGGLTHLGLNNELVFYVKTVNQIANVIKSIKEDPHSRRHIVSAWNVGELDEMALMPCHNFFQFYVRENKLSLMWNQR